MKTFWKAVWIVTVLGSIILGGAIAIHEDAYKAGYKAGQINALTGKIEFQLVTHPDSTKTWEKIDANSPNK